MTMRGGLKPPRTPTYVPREFTTGKPGLIPLASSAQAQLVNVLPGNLQVGAAFTGSVSLAIPALAAGASTTVSGNVSFANAFPGQLSLKSGQSVYVLASAALNAAPASLIIGAPVLDVASTLVGPVNAANLGGTLTAVVYSPGATAGETASFDVWALLLGAWA